mgnify:CR=1 FL=1|tara:strand:- start:6512 stop:8167 length:1656 start_codon:yes stop_codon:yes gene_type:complete
MANKDFTSLLGRKSAGIKFGDIAAAYFSGNNKTSNRRRNALVASFLFNARESKMESEVMQNLQDLEDRKIIAAAEAKSNYDNQFKLQNKYDDIKSKGIFEYYDADAELAFDKYVTEQGMSTRFDGSNEDANKMKRTWKNEYSTNQYDSFIKNEYDPEKAGRLGSFEAYSEPVLNKFKAERRKITSPTELSLVHKVLNKVGIGKNRDQKLESNYIKAEESYNKLLSEKNLYNKPSSKGKTPNLPVLELKKIRITGTEFIKEMDKFNLTNSQNPGIYNASQREFLQLDPSLQTLGKAEEIITSNIVQGYLVENKEKIKEATDRFNSSPDVINNMTQNQKERALAAEIRKATGITNLNQDLLDDARFYGELAIEANNRTFSGVPGSDQYIKEQEAFLKEQDNLYMKAQIAKGRGLLTKEQIGQAVWKETSSSIAAEIELGNTLTIQAIKNTPVSDEIKAVFSETNPEAYAELTELGKLGGLSASDNRLRIDNGNYANEFFELQKKQYIDNRIRTTKRLLDITGEDDLDIPGYDQITSRLKTTTSDFDPADPDTY